MFRELSLALGMFLSTIVSHDTGHAPAGCLVTRHYDDGAYAICLDGPDMLEDRDGQLYVNRAGTPLRNPGWYPVEGN
jgi:hypothetical protein